jgi:hypothetical protein
MFPRDFVWRHACRRILQAHRHFKHELFLGGIPTKDHARHRPLFGGSIIPFDDAAVGPAIVVSWLGHRAHECIPSA